MDKIQKLGLDPVLINYLKLFEQSYANASSEIDFKHCMDDTRTFLEGLCSQTCIKLESLTGKILKRVVGKDKVDFSQAKSYLRQTSGLLTTEELRLLDSIYSYLSEEGIHDLKALKVQARIGKNMAIEISVILLEKLDKVKASN